jgi:exodeoxyribonuclease V alpha subunit
MLEAWSHGRILCAVRNGPAGVTAVNDAVAALLHDEGLIGARQRFYHRRPVLVTRNDYAARLFNGDIGVILEDAHDRRLYAHFPGEQNTTRAVPALRLPDHESAFAMTIHRSQGSEFDHVLIILPPGPSPILSRELLYTAVSRARKSVTIWAEPEAIQFACAREVRRASGLTDRLLAGLER